MSRRESEKDLERPHYYSQYWINIAKQYARTGSLAAMPTIEGMDDEDDEDFDELPVRPLAKVMPPLPEIDDLPLPLPRTVKTPPKQKPPELRPSALTSFADLAALGFGAGIEMEEMPVSDDDDTESVMSRIGSNFDDGLPNVEEAASLEALTEDEAWDDDEEEEDDIGAVRRPSKPTKPIRPPRRPERPF